MTDHSTLEGKIAALSKQVDSQARFTRGVILLCTLAVLAAVFYTITELLSTLPASLVSVSENINKASRTDKNAVPEGKVPSLLAPKIAR